MSFHENRGPGRIAENLREFRTPIAALPPAVRLVVRLVVRLAVWLAP
jgi:hypothetical protein